MKVLSYIPPLVRGWTLVIPFIAENKMKLIGDRRALQLWMHFTVLILK